MSHSLFPREKTQVFIVEPTGTIRMMLTEAVRELGFQHVRSAATLKEALGVMEIEPVHWLITPLLAHDEVNALHILQAILGNSALRHTRVSLFLDLAQEGWCLSYAFEVGLLSNHKRSYVKETILAELESLLKSDQMYQGDGTLVAAHYLRQFLTERRFYQSRLGLEHNLLNMYPGAPQILLSLAEAEIQAGSKERGLTLLHQVELIDPRLCSVAQRMREKHHVSPDEQRKLDLGDECFENALGVNSIVVIDPDTDVLFAVCEMLRTIGVKDIATFEDGQKAYEFLTTSPEPGLILMEWRIPGLMGPLLVQKVRQIGHITVPIMVLSSLTNKDDKPLLKEMGVDGVLEKPFDRQAFFSALVWTLQQTRVPTEQRSLERKIHRLLETGKMSEAQRLIAQALNDERIDEAFKNAMVAEYEYAAGNYQVAVNRGVTALKIGGDSISLLNLVGKAMYRLQQYEGALICFEKGHAISPLNIEKLLSIAETRLQLEKPQEAVSALKEAEKIDPTNTAITLAHAKIVLEHGETSEATELMEQLESGARLTAYVNNRAVLLVLSGRFEEGIALYQRAIKSLPATWQKLRDIVTYNLALAHARYGDYKEVLSVLDKVVPTDEGLLKKVRSLSFKVRRAIKGNTKLQLGDIAEQQMSVQPGGATDGSTNFEELMANVEARRGDLCVYLVYRHIEGHDPKIAEVLNNPPRVLARGKSDGHVSAKDWKKAI